MTPEERDRIRRILLDSVPNHREWITWVDGILARIFTEDDES